LPTSDIIRGTGTSPSTTPPTFPGGDPSSIPSGGQRRGNSLPEIILSRPIRRQPTEPQGSPNDPFPDPSGGPPPPIDRTGGTRKRDTANDQIKAILDQAYLTADSYLRELADRSGGQVQRADTLAMLPQAFAAIAAELRTQYMLVTTPLIALKTASIGRFK
jgi:hypothetical protein